MASYQENYHAARNGYMPPDPYSQGAADGERDRLAQKNNSPPSDGPPPISPMEIKSNLGDSTDPDVLKARALVIGTIIGTGTVLTVLEKSRTTVTDALHTVISAPFDNIDYILAATTGWIAGKTITSLLIKKETLRGYVTSFCIAAAAVTTSVYATKTYIRDNVQVDFESAKISPWSLSSAMDDHMRKMYHIAGRELVTTLSRMSRHTANEVIINPLLFAEEQQNSDVCSDTTNTCENGDKRIKFVHQSHVDVSGSTDSMYPDHTTRSQISEYSFTRKSNPAGALSFKISMSYKLTAIQYFGGNELLYKDAEKYGHHVTYSYGLLYIAMYRLKMPLFKATMGSRLTITNNGKFEPSIIATLSDSKADHKQIADCLAHTINDPHGIIYTPIKTVALKTLPTNTDLGRMLKLHSNNRRYTNDSSHVDTFDCYRPKGSDAVLDIRFLHLAN